MDKGRSIMFIFFLFLKLVWQKCREYNCFNLFSSFYIVAKKSVDFLCG